jgi:hypothetical protein
MKFNLSNLPSVVPVEVSLEYLAPEGGNSNCFHLYNFIDKCWSDGSYYQNPASSNKISLKLEEIGVTQDLTAFIMMSNAPTELQGGGKLIVKVITEDGKTYFSTKNVNSDVTLLGSRLHSITCSEWEEYVPGEYDGFDNPDTGVVGLQEATKGNGTDIIIMGDGFSETHFGANGD